MSVPHAGPAPRLQGSETAAGARQPRGRLQDPKQFGKPRARWNRPSADTSSEDDLAFEAARAQHVVALHGRAQARREQLALADIAEVTTFPNGQRHLGAVLRGEFPLTFRHLIALQTYFAGVVAFGEEVKRRPPSQAHPAQRR